MEVGTDIVKISRVSLEDSFVKGILSENELETYEMRSDKQQFLAGHFAAKEAFLKALGVGLAGADFREVEVRYKEGGQPYIYFHDCEYSASISHDGEYAIAVVLL